MPMFSVLFDAMTLLLLLSLALSALVELIPLVFRWASASASEPRTMLFLPPLGALVLVGLAFWPPLRAALGGGPDHCGGPDAHQPHLCWIHTPASLIHESSHDWATLAVAGLVVGLALAQAFRWGQGHGRLRLLESASSPMREESVRQALAEAGMKWPGALSVLPFESPLCFVSGIFRPRLYISTSVLDAMDAEDVRAVIAHELAHVRRRDNLWRLLGQVALLFHLPGLGHRALRRWLNAAEAACDEAAAHHVGSRLAVAEALVRFQRLAQDRGRASQLGMAFGHASYLDARVRCLLEPPAASPPRWIAAWPLGLALLAVTQADALHDMLEACLRMLHL